MIQFETSCISFIVAEHLNILWLQRGPPFLVCCNKSHVLYTWRDLSCRTWLLCMACRRGAAPTQGEGSTAFTGLRGFQVEVKVCNQARPEWRGENSTALIPSPLLRRGSSGLGLWPPGRFGKSVVKRFSQPLPGTWASLASPPSPLLAMWELRSLATLNKASHFLSQHLIGHGDLSVSIPKAGYPI